MRKARVFKVIFCLQQTFLQYGPPALERGYAFATFDGPGQGSVIRFPPKMPFSPNMDQVMAFVLNVITAAPFMQYIATDRIVVSGELFSPKHASCSTRAVLARLRRQTGFGPHP